MIVVVNLQSPSKEWASQEADFTARLFYPIVHANPQHSFFFISCMQDDALLKSNNVSFIKVSPKKNHVLLWHVWYAWQLPSILKKLQADVYIAAGSVACMGAPIPQLLLLPVMEKEVLPSFFARKQKLFFAKASSIFTFSLSVKSEIAKVYPLANDKTVLALEGLQQLYVQVSEDEKNRAKQKYAEGKEYFLFTGSLSKPANLVNILKAFSFFKKRQKSNMQFIFATHFLEADIDFVTSIETYKYRDDVKLLVNRTEQEMTTITASAYALVNVTGNDFFWLNALKAMQYGVPVIAGNTTLMHEMLEEAALYCDAAVFESIADKLMVVYKDEGTRNRLIAKGKQQAARFYDTNAGVTIWQNILKVTGAS